MSKYLFLDFSNVYKANRIHLFSNVALPNILLRSRIISVLLVLVFVGRSVPGWQKGRRRAVGKSFVGLRTGFVGIADRSRSSWTSLSLSHGTMLLPLMKNVNRKIQF